LFRAEASKTEAQQLTYGGRLASALSEIKRAAGLTIPDVLDIRVNFTPISLMPTLADLQQQAQERPDLRALRIAERQAETEVVRAAGKPDLTASARYTLRNSNFDNVFGLTATGARVPVRDRANVLTFGLSIPILTGSRNRGSVEAAEAREAGARQRRAFLEGTIPLEVGNAYRRLDTARQAVKLLAGVIDQSENNLKVIREAYKFGQLRALDVLNEQRRLVDTRLSYIDTQLEEEQAQIELERATGGPIR